VPQISIRIELKKRPTCVFGFVYYGVEEIDSDFCAVV
jgi:hypothetical protein